MSRIETDLLDIVFRDPGIKHGLHFFTSGEINKLHLRAQDDKIQIRCAKRGIWRRATPEEVVRQLFLVWIQDALGYKLAQIDVEWPLQMGHDAEKERIDIVVFTDTTMEEPHIVFELKRPSAKDGLEQLRSYLNWTGCWFGCWSNGSSYFFQLREEDGASKKAPYKYRDITRLPKLGEDLKDILAPLTFAQLRPIPDMRGLIERLEHDALSNAGVNAFDELFKLFFAKLHDEFRPKRKETDAVAFRVPETGADAARKRLNDLFEQARSRPHWSNIFDDGEKLKLSGDALRLCAATLEPFSLSATDLDAVDAAFEYLVNPEQKGKKGQYFTPRPVVKMAIKMLNPQDGEKLIDPACGSCGFLIHALRHVQVAQRWARHQAFRYANEYLYGVDFDDRLVKVAKTMMIIAGDGKANVLNVNALDYRDWKRVGADSRLGPFEKDVRDGSFDVVATNPPFAGKITGKAQLSAFDLYELAATGQISDDDDDENGNAEPTSESSPRRKVAGMRRDILFVERCLDLLRPGGRMAIVLPQGNLNNLGTAGLRRWFLSRARLLAVVGLHVNTFKPFTSTKTSVVFLQKWGAEAGKPLKDYDVFMGVSERSGKDNTGRYRYKLSSAGIPIDEDGKPATESGKPKAIDHDLDEIASRFMEWGAKQGLRFL